MSAKTKKTQMRCQELLWAWQNPSVPDLLMKFSTMGVCPPDRDADDTVPEVTTAIIPQIPARASGIRRWMEYLAMRLVLFL